MGNPVIKNSIGFRLFEEMQRDNLNYIYRGLFTQSITDSILSLTETNLDKAGEDQKIKKRVFTIMVEGLQNITRHQEVTGNDTIEDKNGIFIIQNKHEKYYITTGNPILKKNISTLTDQITKINSFDPEELKVYYKQVLNDNIISDKGGAGLGLIEMARKSGNKLMFEFVNLSENYSYFYLNTEIAQHEEDTKGSCTLSPGDFAETMGTIKDIHHIINKENIVLIFNGIFNQESLLSLLSIMEGQMFEHNLNFKKRVFNIMVEMLQNIVKHGDNAKIYGQNPGIFFISQKDHMYRLNTGNYIPKNKTEDLAAKIDHVNSLTHKELNTFYEKSLFNFQIDSSKESGLGLIELRLKTKRKLVYEISPFDDEFSFFVLQTTVD
jgi:hypothetical protein